MKKIGLLLISALALTFACKKPVQPVSKITLNKTEITLDKGATETISATVSPSDATDKTITWTSSNNSVATVSDGLVTAKGGGSALITAKAGNATATCKVTVNIPVTGIAITPDALKLDRNTTGQLTATVSPSDATDKAVTWESLNPGIVTVDQTGKVTAIAKGIATIKAKIGAFEGTSTVTVVVSVLNVTLNKNELTLNKDAKETLVATVNPSDADDNTIIWTSSDPSVATVDENGLVKALAGGTSIITASAGGKSASCTVSVNIPGNSEDYEGGNGEWD